MILKIIVLAILLALSFLFKMMSSDKNDLGFVSGVCAGFFSILLCISLCEYKVQCKPSAMDVYQNKTELQITYKGNTPIDTVVVFK